MRDQTLYRLNFWCSQKFSNNGVWLLEDQWIVINFFPMSLSSHCNYNWFTCILFWQKIFICIVNQHLFEYINWQKTPFTLPPIECKCWGDHWNIQPVSLEFYESKIHAGDFFFFKYSKLVLIIPPPPPSGMYELECMSVLITGL